MKKLLFIVFVLLGNLAISQDICDNGIDDDNDGLIDLQDTTDCECEGFESTQTVESLIPNPSFEDRSCCPGSFSQLNCADTWIQASNATSDYYNTCGFTNISSFNPPPNPLPDGNGYVGFYNGNAPGAAEANYKEYIGACLLSPMLAGNTYTLQFNMAHAGGNLTTDISVFGSIDCANLPFGGNDRLFGCPTNGPGWIEMTSTSITFNNTWDLITFTFTPSQNIAAVVIGGSCTPVPVKSYYYADNLILAETDGFSAININKTGSFCTDDIVLTASSDTTGTWQWYKEGVALINETTSTLNISANNFTTGKYSVRLLNGIKCEVVDYVLDTNYLSIPALLDDSICINLDTGKIQVLNITGKNVGLPLQYFIDGAGPYTDSVFTNLSPGTYQMVVSDTNMCRDTSIAEVVGIPLPVPDFSADTVCVGSPTSFYNNSIDASTVLWSFGDGTFSTQNGTNIQHTYNNPGIYMVKLVTENINGCEDSVSLQVLVYDKPIADFSFINDCEEKPIQFTNNTTLGGGTNTSGLNWNWDFGNGSTSTQKDPFEAYLSPGTYNITLTVSSPLACDADTTKQIEIYPNPIADFNVSPICLGEITQINDLSSVSSGTIINWQYTTENIEYTVQNPMHQYSSAGSYNVTLVVSSNNGCKDSITHIAEVNPLPIANFDFSPELLTIFKSEVCFNNMSQGAISYFWDYGFLGNISVITEECIKYPTDVLGEYDVFLRAVNQYGCTDSITKTIEIQDEFVIYVPNTFTPDGDGKNDIFIPKMRGVNTIDFYVFNRWGDEIFYTNKLNFGWDGTFKNNELCKEDTYVYRIIVMDIFNKKHVKEGHVNLVK